MNENSSTKTLTQSKKFKMALFGIIASTLPIIAYYLDIPAELANNFTQSVLILISIYIGGQASIDAVNVYSENKYSNKEQI